MKATVLGAGSWGTALGSVLQGNGCDTYLWAKRADLAGEINIEHTNRKYLGDTVLPSMMRATSDVEEALVGADLAVYTVPSASIREVVRLTQPFLQPNTVVAHAVKGFDLPSNRRVSELLREEVPGIEHRLGVIAGPSHAEEVALRMPTTIVVAAFERQTAETIQDSLMNPYLRVYTNPDVVGVEMGGALKNIIALAVGIADGLGFGDNAKAALMTRGLAEIARLGMKLGASPLTFAGLSGVGDLIVTCTSRHSRNFRAGRLLGQGASLTDTLTQIGMAVEGVRATKAALVIAREHGVEMPITQTLDAVLYHAKSPRDGVEDLMGRERGHEIEEVVRESLSPKWSLPTRE